MRWAAKLAFDNFMRNEIFPFSLILGMILMRNVINEKRFHLFNKQTNQPHKLQLLQGEWN